MQSRHEVVVVGGLPETEEVLRAVFEPRGVDVVSLSTSESSCPVSLEESRVLVVHRTERPDEAHEIGERTTAPRVFIGRFSPEGSHGDDRCRCLPVPFQYADLISAIEELAVPSTS